VLQCMQSACSAAVQWIGLCKHVCGSRDAGQWMMKSLIRGIAVGTGTTALPISHKLVRTTKLAFHCVVQVTVNKA